MTNLEKLLLTPEQMKAFESLERAYAKCEKAGIRFIGFGEANFALNGKYIESIDDYGLEELNENEVNFNTNQRQFPSVYVEEPWIDVTVKITVKED